MDLKQLKKLINEEVSKFKLNEQDLSPEETTVTDPRISRQPEKTPPATPMAKLGQKRPPPPPQDPNELPPELQRDDDGFEGFGGPAELQPLEPQDIEGTNGGPIPPQIQKLLNNPAFIKALRVKLGLK